MYRDTLNTMDTLDNSTEDDEQRRVSGCMMEKEHKAKNLGEGKLNVPTGVRAIKVSRSGNAFSGNSTPPS